MNTKYRYFIFLFIGSLFLMFDAFYNHFPIVYSDTSTYLASGFQLETPMDRPITYGLFLRAASMNGLSLWSVIFFQALIISFLIFQLSKMVFTERSYLRNGLIVVFFLSFFTGLSWTVCQVIPDVFTAAALLSMVLILFSNTSRASIILFYTIFLLSAAMHMSHLILFAFLLLNILLLRKYILPITLYPKRNIHLGILFLLLSASVLTMGSALSKSRHIFFMGAMAEHGILKKYLDENCSKQNYRLCAYKDSIPQFAYQFVWEKYSPLYKIGSWKDVKPEFDEIIKATLTQPKYIKMHFSASIKATADQLTKFRINDGNGSFSEGSTLYERIVKYIPADVNAYSSSLQSKKELGFTDIWNTLFTFVVIASILILIILPEGFRKCLKTVNGNILLILTTAIIINAWDCGTFANAIDRLGCKMIWLLPMFALYALLKQFARKEARIRMSRPPGHR